uniref:YdbS-like PH domain-containing protein n=1 Tax=Pinguiococcus pyrenoidosus TaxID=172671 RepID=A0A7R9UCQ1_9STRA|mmetsp:Transcript_5731/g.22466  ORF Transcript_5731/g.22466 Transcript_5731/m.22466 type:complete len:203 (+) Transcript_5731:87-695(+)
MVSTALLLVALFQGAGAFMPQAPVGSRLLAPRGLARPLRQGPLFGKPKLSDMLEELDEDAEDGAPKKSQEAKVALEPEEVFYEGPPSKSELVGPALSIFTVIGLIPFSAAAVRQAWVRYTITSRRIRVTSGYQGQDETEIIYPDIKSMKYAWRSFGAAGDVVIELRDGARVEMRSLPEFERLYKEIFSRISEDAQEESDSMK